MEEPPFTRPHINMITFPIKALENKGEDGASALPAVGDSVPIPEAMGVVSSIDGDNITVDLKTVAGMPATYAEGKEECDPTDDGDKMKSMAEASDKAAGLM